MTGFAMNEECVACGGAITGPRVHDRGRPWHAACRKDEIALRAERRAIRLTGRHLHLGRVLVQIQRKRESASSLDHDGALQ